MILEVTYSLPSDKALNGKQALDRINERENERMMHLCTCYEENSNYTLIFMDCNMPIMDGFEATNKIIKMVEEDQIIGP